ncbi:efflux RND transporter periplasmic adaptor subunit [Caenimonas terrae]|uniref:Efflux RND transporter periplasmic adaptor subunit n=1 Tax=Caenimonas terrae TaxID=696074 RepID=A0ABW0NDY4_9BURK
MLTRRIATRILLAAGLAVLAGCGEKSKAATEDTVARVKTMVVKAGGEARRRSLVGEVQPMEVWNLAFPVAGRITQLAVAEGDRVKKGQLLARIDPVPYEVRLKNAEAELRSSVSDSEEKRDALAARKTLSERGFMAASMVERYRVDYTLAQQKVSSSESAVALARRDLAATRLLAPADGVVSARQVEPFADVNAGQSVLRLDGAGGMRVAVRVPENLIEDFAVGAAAAIEVGGRKLQGRVSRIDARAGVGDSFPAYIALSGATQGLRAGVTAKVDFVVRPGAGGSERNIQVPMQAVLPGNGPGQGYVFVLDKSGNSVRRVPVQIRAVNDADMEIGEGLAPGDEIVTAGVAFLSDGQPVKRMQAMPGKQ